MHNRIPWKITLLEKKSFSVGLSKQHYTTSLYYEEVELNLFLPQALMTFKLSIFHQLQPMAKDKESGSKRDKHESQQKPSKTPLGPAETPDRHFV